MLCNNEIIHEIKYGSFLLSVNTQDFNENIIIDCDDYFVKFSGYSKEEIKQQKVRFRSLLLDDEYYYICNFVKNNINALGEIYLEHKMKCKSGAVLIITNCCEILTRDDNNIILKVTITQAFEASDPRFVESYNFLDFNAILENMPCGIAVYKVEESENVRKLHLTYANPKFYSQLGHTKESYIKATDGGYVGNLIADSESKEKIFNKIFENLTNTNPITFKAKVTKADGSEAVMSINGRVFSGSDGIPRVQAVFFDITKTTKAEETIKFQNERYKIIEENTDELMFDYDIKKDILYLPKKKRFKKFGYKFNGYINGGICKSNIHPDDYIRFISLWKDAMKSDTKNYVDVRTKAFDDEYCWYRVHYVSVSDSCGTITHIYGRYANIDNERKLHLNSADAEAKIEKLTMSDHITGLLNRQAFKLQAREIIKNYNPENECLSVVYSDINNFSFVNDNYGYDAGDSMLNDFASIINNMDNVRKSSRINSDLFVFMLSGKDKDDIVSSVEYISQRFYNIQKQKYKSGNFTVASGIYYIQNSDEDISYIIDNADLARKNIKANKEINICIYKDDFRIRRTREKSIVTKLQNAINEHQIELFLQPKFSMNSRKVVGAEALARWRNNDGSYKFPGEFIDILEKAGYIVELDFFIYEEALKCIKRWRDDGKKLIPISVNFSRKNNINPEFTRKVLELAKKYNVNNCYIEFEITESAFAENTIAMFQNMNILREHGFKVDIDDFGIGYSSLSFLLNSPIDTVKVDKVFVDGIEKSKYHRDFIRQMCMLINTTNKEIIFEGVETENQAEFLCKCGFDFAQGWLFDKAIRVEEFERKYIYT